MVTKEAIKNFPDSCGVYLMYDFSGAVIYVGKALSLKKRVSSYFLKNQNSVKTQILMTCVARIAYQKTRSEYGALILEAKLIREYKPRFNISLKDDKSFPFIKITRSAFPCVTIGRRKRGEKNIDYFGPYTSAKLLRRALDFLRKSFPFRTCRKLPKKTCLYYDLRLCPGPCQGKVTQKEYIGMIRALEDFLMKEDLELIEELSLDMRKFAQTERFEEAAKTRDKLEALSLLASIKKTGSFKPRLYETDFQELGLAKVPERIEAFDISNIASHQAVGSMVSFHKGKPNKSNYRRFKIKTISKINDYAMIEEIVRRRVTRLVEESAKMPDLMVIDGGRGHLEAAKRVLKALGVDIPVVAIAKNEELIYTAMRQEPFRFDRSSEALRLIQRLRDEAHRFACAYHKLLRKKNFFKNEENSSHKI